MEHFFSGIQPHLKRYLIKRSFLFAFPGFFLVFYMGIFLSTSSLERWGLLGFIVGFTMISFGMIPYRRIRQLEIKPHRLSLDEKRLFFIHSKKGEIQFPIQQIKKLLFIQRKGFYGIRLHLKDGSFFLFPYFSKETLNSIDKLIS